jgi:filamentous hemagglutinin
MLVSAAMALASAGTSLGVFESTLLSNFVTGTINNGGNLAKGLKVATSEDSLKGAFKAWVGAELTKGIAGGLGTDDIAGLEGLDKALAITQQEVTRAVVSGIMNGQDLGSIIKSAAFNAALANVQNKIGDLGEAHGVGGTLQDGGLAKTALHAAAGGAFSAASGGSFTSGAVGGAASVSRCLLILHRMIRQLAKRSPSWRKRLQLLLEGMRVIWAWQARLQPAGMSITWGWHREF